MARRDLCRRRARTACGDRGARHAGRAAGGGGEGPVHGIITVMPKQVDAAAQRRAIAGAAIAVIDGAGLDGARLRDVARAANVTTGAVTHYFDDKDAVLEAALEEVVRRILAKQDRAR